MPMKQEVNLNSKIFEERIYVGSGRVYKITKKDIFVEMHHDLPSVSPAEFWRDLAYSGRADELFPDLDPNGISFKAYPGQYDIGTDVYAYGRMLGDNKALIEEIQHNRSKIREDKKRNSEIQKKINDLEKSKLPVPHSLYFDYNV